MWNIADEQLGSGEKRFTSLIVRARHDRVEVPLFLAAGAKTGPTLFLIGGEHGTELTASETIRRFFETLDCNALSGNVVAVPVANPLAVRSKQHSYPYDRAVWFSPLDNMNRSWPGSVDGTVTQAITHTLFELVMKHSDGVVSMHSTNYRPYLGYTPGDETSKRLCLDYGRISLIYSVEHEGSSVNVAARQLKIPSLLVEWPALRLVNHSAIREGIVGINNILVSMGMQEGTIRRISDQYLVDYSQKKSEVHAQEDGILVRHVSWGAPVKRGQVVAKLYDLYRYREAQQVVAPFDAIVNNTGPTPPNLSTFYHHTDAVRRGEMIAQFLRYDEHVSNAGGDPWLNMLLGGPDSEERVFQ